MRSGEIAVNIRQARGGRPAAEVAGDPSRALEAGSDPALQLTAIDGRQRRSAFGRMGRARGGRLTIRFSSGLAGPCIV